MMTNKIRTCSVDGCNRKYQAKGLCATHRWRLEKHGDVHYCKHNRGEARKWIENLISTPVCDLPSKCIEWPFGKKERGYGQFHNGGDKVGAHRKVLQLWTKESPLGLECLHSCDNPGCVNPKHLSWDTHHENMKQASERGLLRKKITAHLAREIYLASGTCDALGERFGVSRSMINLIKLRKSWKSATRKLPAT